MLNKYLGLFLFLSFSNFVYAGNFSYTYLGIDIGKATLDEEIFFNGYLYEELGYASFQGSYQFNENIVLSVESSSMSNKGGNTELSYSNLEFIASFPFSLGENTDIVPFIGARNDEVEACISIICATEDESFIEYGAKLRVWLVLNKIELNIKYLNANSDGFDPEFGFGGAFMISENHRININHRVEDSASLTSLGYRYNW